MHDYKGWTNFRIESLKYLEQGFDWVIFADVSAYFENISIQRLISDLGASGVSKEIRNLLSACLNRWAEPRSRGIPQGNRPSFILAELYFDSIDRRLRNKKMTFNRYVDDIRIFCHSRDEAIASLHFLTVVLREKELNLQTAKSYILNAEEARKEIDGISETVDKIEEEIKEELRNELEFQTDYATPSAIENYLDSIDKEVKLESIRRAFTDFFLTDNSLFDKTLFHYCINRLGAANDDFAIEFCLKCIVDRPEEFIHILPYFSKLESKKVYLAEKMIAHFSNESQTLGRQYFLLLRWVYSERISSEKIVELCRELAFRTDLDNYTRHYAWAILGRIR